MARYQRKDSYHRRAKSEGYRSRAAYKLLELQQRRRLLPRGARVVELGCWPGGWLQVAARAVGPQGIVVGIDLAATEPLPGHAGVRLLEGDFTDPALLGAIRQELGGGLADVLLSDAAPKLSGVRDVDRAREEALLEGIEAAVPVLLAPGGTLLVKLIECPEARDFVRRIRAGFESAREVTPRATRKGSSERYLLALGYRRGAA